MNKLFAFSILFSAFILNSCEWVMPPEQLEEEILNTPNTELTQTQLALHLKGDGEFGRKFSARDGLGPIFVSNSCESCHFADGKGHPSLQFTRYGRQNPDGSFDPMLDFGGPQLQERSVDGYTGETFPPGLTGKSVFIPPSVAGLGFLELVEDSEILKLSDPLDINADGISGVPNYISAPDYFVQQSHHIPENGKFIGRFGRKAGAIDLLNQVVNAYIQDMGITSDFVMKDLYNYRTGITTGDDVPEPEVSSAVVNLVVFYVKTLSAPPRRKPSDPDVVKGEKIFAETGCVGCHVPTMKTGFSNIEALSYKTFHPFTDLLLHDMGPELDDFYTEGTAKTNEWRTTPLWGLGLSPGSQGGKMFLLHDGRAKTIEKAVDFHGGEASDSREKFRNLSKIEKDRLIKFLMSL